MKSPTSKVICLKGKEKFPKGKRVFLKEKRKFL
jgi:hypothetical protein